MIKLIFIMSFCSQSGMQYNCEALYQSCMNHLRQDKHLSYGEQSRMCTDILIKQVLKRTM